MQVMTVILAHARIEFDNRNRWADNAMNGKSGESN
jgi:hypothetical protein